MLLVNWGLSTYVGELELDDTEVFEEQMLIYFKTGSSVVAAINWRVLCDRCYPDFARARGKTPRPDIYIMHLERRGQKGTKKG
ncbi:hypothetical protein CW696_06035 [ANME-2 cluster archaeon]|nr:MAG: hypothetical protein CW696_06035 [ANME-2 cluster archaeon]